MSTLIFSNDVNFTAVSNCAVSDGSVSLLPYTNDCSALTDFTPTNTSAGTIDVTTNSGAITIVCNTTNSQFSPNNFTGPYAKLNNSLVGDFDVSVEIELSSNVNANYEGAFLCFFVDAQNFIRLSRFYNSGHIVDFAKVVSGTQTNVASTSYSGTSLWLRLTRSSNAWTAYYSPDGSNWTALAATIAAVSSTGYLTLGAATYNTSGSCTIQYKTLTFLSGLYFSSGSFTVHDSGVSYTDTGSGLGLDLSTLEKTHTSGAIVSAEYYHSNNAGDTPSCTSYAWAELIALAANGHRYHWLRLTLENAGAAAVFNELTADTYAVDVTAPGDPTSTKFIQFETNNFALIWTEPEDSGGGQEASGLSHIELRCDVGGSTYYLGVGAGGPEWQASPTSYWKFKEGLGGSGITPASDFIDESASGTRSYYARAVDNAGNKSSWAAFSAGVVLASTAPTSLSITDAGDGLTWQVAAAGMATGAALLLYNSSTDALVAILDASAKTRDLTAGVSLYVKALEPGKELSARYPSATGVSTPTLTANFGTDASNLKSGASIRVDGTTTNGSYTPDFPERANVAPDDTVDGLSGTMDLPDLASVLSTDTLRGEHGIYTSPEVEYPTLPNAGEVWEGAPPFGYSDSLITPTRVEPVANEVRLGVVFSDPESPITGTYTGEAVPIAKGKLVGVDNGDGTMTFTISEGSSLAINRVYFAAVKSTGELTWVLAGTRTGNGTLTATIPNGAYWAFVRSSWE